MIAFYEKFWNDVSALNYLNLVENLLIFSFCDYFIRTKKPIKPIILQYNHFFFKLNLFFCMHATVQYILEFKYELL